MKAVFEAFLTEMVHDVPFYIYEMLFYSLCLVAVIAIAFKGWKKGVLITSRFALVEYVFLIYCSTVLFRKAMEVHEHYFTPFWSYAAYDRVNRPDLLPEKVMNIIVFLPLGFLLGAGIQKMKWWAAMLIGSCISLSIETLQYYFNLGVSEFDDVMHNSLGCMIGFGLYYITRYGYEKFIKRRMAVL